MRIHQHIITERISILQSTPVISTSLGPYENDEVSKCRHKCLQRYADEFSLCLTLYKCTCLTYKSMEDVCSCPIIIVCERDKFIRDLVFDNNEAYNHIFQV